MHDDNGREDFSLSASIEDLVERVKDGDPVKRQEGNNNFNEPDWRFYEGSNEDGTDDTDRNDFEKQALGVCPFPFDVLPDKLRKVIINISDAQGVEPELVAILMLTVISAAIGNTVRISPKSRFEIPIFLWLIVIADSGDNKTSTIDICKSHVLHLQGEASKRYEEEMKIYQNKMATRKKTQPLPEEPIEEHFLVSDYTVESLGKVFKHSPRGELLHRDEIAGLFTGMNMYRQGKGNDLQHFLELFNAGSWKINRKSGNLFVPNTGVAINGGIQPRVMPRVFVVDNFYDGLLSRFLLYPIIVSKANLLSLTSISDDDLSCFNSILDYCYSIPIDLDKNGFVKPKILSLGDKACNVWKEFHDNYSRLKMLVSERTKTFIPKWHLYSLKFIGILHILRNFERGIPANVIRNEIDEATVSDGIRILKFYIGKALETFRLYDDPRNRLNELQIRLIRSLEQLRFHVKYEKLAYSQIADVLFSGGSGDSGGCPKTISISKTIGSLLRSLGLKGKESTGGVYYLIWEEEKIKRLLSYIKHYNTNNYSNFNDNCNTSKQTSTTSTTSTKTDLLEGEI